MRPLKRPNASGSKPPYRSTLSRARARSWSSVQPALATPITGMSRLPRLASACRAGNIFLWARSPVAPKKTSASEEPALGAMPSFIVSNIVFMSLSAFPTTLLFHKPHVLVAKIRMCMGAVNFCFVRIVSNFELRVSSLVCASQSLAAPSTSLLRGCQGTNRRMLLILL